VTEYRSSLRDNVHRLTREHLTRVDGELVVVPAFLDQLETAVSPGNDGGTSNGKPLPINVTAIDLMRSIDTEAREHQAELIPSFKGTLKQVIQSWAVEDINGEWMVFLEHVTLDWLDRIRALLNPTKPPRKLHRPCPACGVLYGGEDNKPGLLLHCWGDDEGLLPPGKWTAECVHCGAAWNADELGWLTRAINPERIEA
jgi:hypothetical protein